MGIIRWENRCITKLEPGEIFVFGSNLKGFHGAGSAGYACRGDYKNLWRQDPWFITAMGAEKGSHLRVGKWAVYGVAEGIQYGREGASYAIPVIKNAGHKRSIPLEVIHEKVTTFHEFVQANPSLHFWITPVGEGYGGFTSAEMALVWGDFYWPERCVFVRVKTPYHQP